MALAEYGIEARPFRHAAGLTRAAGFCEPRDVLLWSRDHLSFVEEVPSGAVILVGGNAENDEAGVGSAERGIEFLRSDNAMHRSICVALFRALGVRVELQLALAAGLRGPPPQLAHSDSGGANACPVCVKDMTPESSTTWQGGCHAFHAECVRRCMAECRDRPCPVRRGDAEGRAAGETCLHSHTW